MDIQTFLQACDRYCEQTSLSEARLSTIIFGSGVTIGRLRAGKGVTVRVLTRAVGRLQDRIASDGEKTVPGVHGAVSA